MSVRHRLPWTPRAASAAAVALAFSAPMAAAQVSAPTSSGSPGAADPNPYYVGISQALTHDSNVFRIPSGTGDNYSSTSLFGGFDQPISRQRLFGRGAVTANRYQDQDQLNNVSYNLGAGLDWQTIERLSGNVNLGLNRSLATPTASGGIPSSTRNVASTTSADAKVRWGGASILTLEGGLGYSKLDYSSPQYASSESSHTTESLGLYYRPGGPLRLGVAARVDQTRTPKAFVDPATGATRPTTVEGRNIDFSADYDLTGLLAANGRVSYTRQKNSGISNADFSGLTGSAALNWRATGKISVRLDAAREAGFDTAAYSSFAFTPGPNGIVLTPVTGLYENNRVTNSVGVGADYAATAKISATASARYSRARLSTVDSATASVRPGGDVTDVSKIFTLGVNYAVARNWGAGCNLGHEGRDVSGATSFAYTANTIGCSTQFTWR